MQGDPLADMMSDLMSLPFVLPDIFDVASNLSSSEGAAGGRGGGGLLEQQQAKEQQLQPGQLQCRPGVQLRGRSQPETSHLIKVDVAESPEAFSIIADVPGAPKEDVKLEVDDTKRNAVLLHLSYDRKKQFGLEQQQGQGQGSSSAGRTTAGVPVQKTGTDQPLGQQPQQQQQQQFTYFHSECGSGHMHRTIRLPPPTSIEVDKISAQYNNGTLHVVVPKKQAQQQAEPRKRIEIA